MSSSRAGTSDMCALRTSMSAADWPVSLTDSAVNALIMAPHALVRAYDARARGFPGKQARQHPGRSARRDPDLFHALIERRGGGVQFGLHAAGRDAVRNQTPAILRGERGLQ